MLIRGGVFWGMAKANCDDAYNPYRLRLLVLNWRHLGPAGRKAVAGQVAMAGRDKRLAPQLEKLVRQPDMEKVLGGVIKGLKAAPSRAG